MSTVYSKYLNEPIPQSEQASPNQVPNNAGGWTFTVTPEARLERFLILGTDGGTYYVSEKDLTKQNVDWLIKRISGSDQSGLDVLSKVIEVSVGGRAYRNSPAIFVLALLFKYGTKGIKPVLPHALPKICRTSTHLFEFAEYVEALGGWGVSKRRAVANWYTSQSSDALAYQVVKYRQRNGWTHRDMLRLSHPIGIDPQVGNFILGKSHSTVPAIIDGFEQLQAAEKYAGRALATLEEFKNLPWEALPTELHKNPEIWKKLFYNGQINGQALVRNIVRLARIDAFDDMVFAGDYAVKLVDEEMIARTRLHPLNYLNAYITYTEGQIDRKHSYGYYANRKIDWTINPKIREALNSGFYAAFKYVEPAGKRTLVGLDVSSSMSALCLGLDISAAQMAAAMSMSILKSEPYVRIMGFSNEFRDLNISPDMSLNSILATTTKMNFGRTDCALPMIWAMNNNIQVDTFLVVTDNETWAGNVHPHIALQNYRQKTGIPAKLVVAAVTATDFTIADPDDVGMLDCVGADANLSKVVADFSAGRI